MVTFVLGYTDDEFYAGDDNNITLISKLDVSNPLHSHPNDSAALAIGKNKIGFIDGSCQRSNSDEVSGRQWDIVNVVVLGWILNSIYEELFRGQFFSKRAKHVWEELKETYDKVKCYVETIYALIELPRCTCHATDDFNKHNQLMKLMQFLMGLDDTYMQIRYSILSRETLLDRSQTFAFVVNAPNRGNFQRSQTFTSFSRPSSDNISNDNGNRITVGESALVCENCGFNGHTIDKCFKIIGANQYMTYTDKNLVNVIDVFYLKIKVSHPNRTEAFITKTGNISLTQYLALYDVLVVPEYCISLMSVHKVSRDSKLIVAFDEMNCYVLNKDLRARKILGSSKQIGGLYYFDGNQGELVRLDYGDLIKLRVEMGSVHKSTKISRCFKCELISSDKTKIASI
ncbi:hypothetical protein Tco_1343351 [Tanacetum coccineum]